MISAGYYLNNIPVIKSPKLSGKFMNEESINVSNTISASWTRGLNLIRETYLYPLNSLPRVRNYFHFESRRFILDNELITLIYYYSLVFSPSMLILTWSYIKNFMKLIPSGLRVIEVRLLRTLDYQTLNDLYISSLVFNLTILILTGDVIFTMYCVVIMFSWNFFIRRDFVRLWLTRYYFWSKIYGQRDHNIIIDPRSGVFNPMEPISNLLGLVDRELNESEEIPAFREMVRLLKKEKLVKSYLFEQKSIRKKELVQKFNNKKKKQKKKKLVKNN